MRKATSGHSIASYRLELTGAGLTLLVCLLFVPQVLSFSHRNDPLRTYREIPFWRQLEDIEYMLYDQRFWLRGPENNPARQKIAIIAIDEESLLQLKDWPFPRDWHASVIKRLRSAGAKAIFLDFLFSIRQNVHCDAALAQAVRARPDVLLPSDEERNEVDHGGTRGVLYQLIGPIDKNAYDNIFLSPNGLPRKNVAERDGADFQTFSSLGLEDSVPEPCVTTVNFDSDGNLRRIPFRWNISDDLIGSPGVAAAGIYQGLIDGDENQRYDNVLGSAKWPDLAGDLVSVPLEPLGAPPGDDPYPETTLIDFQGPPSFGPSDTFATYPFCDVLGFDLREGGFRLSDSEMRKDFGGRIVFVGSVANVLKDNFQVPSFLVTEDQRQDPDSTRVGVETGMSGVEIDATLTAMLLGGQFLCSQSTAGIFECLFGLSLVGSLLTIGLRGHVSRVSRGAQLAWRRAGRSRSIHGPVWLTLYAVVGLFPAVGFWEFAVWAFIHEHLWVVVVYPMLGSLISNAMMLTLLFGDESADRRKTVAQLGRFIAPEVMEEVLARPEEEYPQPKRLVATVLFTDIAGFTPFSEKLDPAEVIAALSSYMTQMVPVIHEFGGTVDKYSGDAIMAFFGAPIPVEDHAARAVRCAVAMQKECARFRAETGIQFYTRIGIHTGEVIAGSMGSQGRGKSAPLLNYALVGDTVNLASRLEGANKVFGSAIMCSAATYAAAPTVVEARNAETRIKGMSETVEVYMVTGLAGEPDTTHEWVAP